jgi:hypothetical protein
MIKIMKTSARIASLEDITHIWNLINSKQQCTPIIHKSWKVSAVVWIMYQFFWDVMQYHIPLELNLIPSSMKFGDSNCQENANIYEEHKQRALMNIYS